MKLYVILLSVFLFFSALFVISSVAIPTCTFRAGGGPCNSGETCIFSVYQQNNTHVGSCDYANTSNNFIVCCTEINSVAIRPSCFADEGGIVSMYATSNSHAGRRDYYSNIVCAKTANNPILTTIRSSCLSRENCIATLFQENNTHVGRCNYYSNRVCIQENFNVTITMILNASEPDWGESVMLFGNATRADGSAIDTSADPEDVEVFLNDTIPSRRICLTDTNSTTGGYTCNFTAPTAVGVYQLNVTVDDPTTNGRTWSNTTTFNVVQKFGETKAAETTAESIACYEEPRIVQNPDGTIEVAIVRICVWK